MPASLKDIILEYIEDALDADDLETLTDYIRSVVAIEGLSGLPLTEALQQLHADLLETYANETQHAARSRYKIALGHFEADFSAHLVERETGRLSGAE